MKTAFETANLSFAYPLSRQPALHGLSIVIQEGMFFTIIGPNGSGKSTLLKLLLGALRPTSGIALYDGEAATEWDRRELAKRVAVVPQIEEAVFPFTVRELVAMGRYPHLGPWRSETASDRDAIARALAACDISNYAERSILTLSGGERQRARVARALAQEPRALVLDEPTASLDLGHEMALFELLASLREEKGVTVVAATHNVNLAARFATHMLLLAGGERVALGEPREVLQRERLEQVYAWPITVFSHPGPGRDTGKPQILPLAKDSSPFP
jgi:iron complex transport system ATP-binding protein